VQGYGTTNTLGATGYQYDGRTVTHHGPPKIEIMIIADSMIHANYNNIAIH
jgi:hypothetical protein